MEAVHDLAPVVFDASLCTLCSILLFKQRPHHHVGWGYAAKWPFRPCHFVSVYPSPLHQSNICLLCNVLWWCDHWLWTRGYYAWFECHQKVKVLNPSFNNEMPNIVCEDATVRGILSFAPCQVPRWFLPRRLPCWGLHCAGLLLFTLQWRKRGPRLSSC